MIPVRAVANDPARQVARVLPRRASDFHIWMTQDGAGGPSPRYRPSLICGGEESERAQQWRHRDAYGSNIELAPVLDAVLFSFWNSDSSRRSSWRDSKLSEQKKSETNSRITSPAPCRP